MLANARIKIRLRVFRITNRLAFSRAKLRSRDSFSDRRGPSNGRVLLSYWKDEDSPGSTLNLADATGRGCEHFWTAIK
jgi:hypothetical protein